MTDIKALEARVSELKRLLDEAKQSLLAAKTAASGIAPGDIVLSKGKRYRVVEVDPEWTKPWISGNPQRKDGSFGTAVRSLFDNWERTK